MINWQEIKFFSPDEFPKGESGYIDEGAIKRYVSARKITRVPWWPSKVPGATARFDGSETSRHFAVGRLSDALDFFPGKEVDLPWFIFQLCSSGLFGGIGVYFDTKGFEMSSDIMFHVDCRPCIMGFPLLWYRDNQKYYYVTNPKSFKGLCRRLNEL